MAMINSFYGLMAVTHFMVLCVGALIGYVMRYQEEKKMSEDKELNAVLGIDASEEQEEVLEEGMSEEVKEQ